MSIVCIAGMHRSGTSMVTRLLNICGLYLGNEGDLLPADPNNSEGYWENRHFVTLNDEILSELGGGWDFQPRKRLESADQLPLLKSQALELVQNFSAYPNWGWKDPRNSLLLPFWTELLPSIKLVICVRNPLEVVNSLIKRNDFSPAHAFNLWWAYNQQIFLHTSQSNRIITHYDSYFQDPASELARISRFLEIEPNEDQIVKAISTISTPSRHNQSSQEALISQCPLQVFLLYQKMCIEAGKYSATPIEEVKPDNSNQRFVLENLEEENQVTVDHLSQALKTASEVNLGNEKLIKSLRNEAAIKDAKSRKLEKELVAKKVAFRKIKKTLKNTRSHLKNTQSHLNQIINSKAWKFALFLRNILLKVFPH
jgi:hypothetical protein